MEHSADGGEFGGQERGRDILFRGLPISRLVGSVEPWFGGRMGGYAPEPLFIGSSVSAVTKVE